jgi:hypothetical protein
VKQHNEYELLISEQIPKSVLAAVLVSEYLNRLGIKPEDLNDAIVTEWSLLHQQGIIPQRPMVRRNE